MLDRHWTYELLKKIRDQTQGGMVTGHSQADLHLTPIIDYLTRSLSHLHRLERILKVANQPPF